ncbi:MAG: hypothetical protein EB127_07855 [Alphaproteobacteria bacterium]|nr:hypothetical protein [Alphaproteobacteria bacterium]
MKTFNEFISEASRQRPRGVSDDMYSQPMRTHASARAPGSRKTPKERKELRAAAERVKNLPNPTKLTKTERDIAHQKELEKQALHNIRTGNTSSSTAKVGKSLEQMKADLAAQRMNTFGSDNPMRHKDEPKNYAHELPQQIPARNPPSSTSRPVPAKPRRVKKTPPPSPVKK